MQNEAYKMDVEGIKKSINDLVVNLTFKAGYNSFLDEDKRLLIVEGKTDEDFIEEHLEEDVSCIVANKAFGSRAGFEQNTMNYKRAIVQVVYGLSKLPTLIKIPKLLENRVIYGMVDLDYEKPTNPELLVQRLFVTDTHDLETLILSSDNEVLLRIKACVIPQEDIQKALYLAYQIAKARDVLFDVSDRDFEINAISGGNDRDVDYARFVENYEINVKKLVKYINHESDNSVSTAKEKKIAEKAMADKRLKKRLTKEGIWNSTWDKFNPSDNDDYWEVVNGHDILSLLRYINLDASNRYANQNGYSLNRAFEEDLIKNYEYTRFAQTRMYLKMYSEKVIKEIIT